MAFQPNKEMNSTINDLSNCQICFDPFGSKECCPRMLSCGHTFCHSCLQMFISEGRVCPTCKEDFNFISADDIPINFTVKSLSETINKKKDPTTMMVDPQDAASSTDISESLIWKKATKNLEFPYEGHCEEHFSPNQFKCLDCNKYICGICALLMHKSCTNVFPILDAVNFMKTDMLKKVKVFNAYLEEEGTVLNSQLDHLTKKQEKLHKEIEIVEAEVKETKSKIERNQNLHQESTGYKDNLDNATSNGDYDKVDAKVQFFLNENCVDIRSCSPPSHSYTSSPSILSIEDASKVTRKDLQEKTFYVMKMEDEEKKYAKMTIKDHQISFDKWGDEVEEGASCVDFLDFINSRTAVIDTHKFIEEHKKKLHNPKFPETKFKCSKIEVKEREVHFDSFRTSEGIEFGFKFGSLLMTLGCSTVIPAEVFLKLQSSPREEVVITTDGGSPRALNFLLLASGILDKSYQSTKFNIKGSIVYGGYNDRWNFFPSVVEEIQDGGIYQKVIERGDIRGGFSNRPNELSYFGVSTKDSFGYSTSIFGRVRKGMEVVDKITSEKTVHECGLLFNQGCGVGKIFTDSDSDSDSAHSKLCDSDSDSDSAH